MKTFLLVGLVLLLRSANAAAQLTITLTAVPATGAGDTVYVAGSFNGWQPRHAGYRLRKSQDGYAITLPDSVRGLIEFKFTLGTWDRVETDAAGADVDNRRFTVPATGPATYTSTVAGWKDPAKVVARRPTASASVSILSPAFELPQLGRTRRVWIYLPPDYATSQRRYPVLYMHDGQNVFDAATSYAGEWGVDEALDSLHARGDSGVIVVAVDHGGERRFDEYSPWQNPRYGGGQGDAYVEFLVKTLKPYVDGRFRTLPEAAHTAVVGSSMGGLISLYAALKYPAVFGHVGVFSPAFWVAPALPEYAREHPPAIRPRVYLVTWAGEARRAEQVAVAEPLLAALRNAGYRPDRDLVVREIEDGAHSEWFWRREFPAAYRWLFER